MTQAEKTMLRYQYVMANSQHILTDFSRTSESFHNVLTKLKANFMTLKGTIGTSLMNLFKPIMVVVNNAIVVINQFAKAVGDSLGKILGWRYEVGSGAVEMSDMADYADDTASGLGKAGKAAQELKRQLQGFDELNNLTTNDDNGGGGSGGSGGGLGGASGASNLAGQWVKEQGLFESDWDTWFKLGRGISEAWTEGLNSIDWDSVYKTFDNFGIGLASFLNGLITPDLFGALGTTIAGSLNSALHFLNSFGTTFDWLNFGNSLASGINKFFSTFDFKLAGKAISVWIKGGLDACIEFLDKTDFEKIGQGIADFISELDIVGIVDKLGKLAVKLIEALGEAIVGLGENNPLAAAIVGLLSITKLVGFGEALSGAIKTTSKGKSFNLKKTAIGVLLTIGSIGLLNSADDLTSKLTAALGVALGANALGLNLKKSIGLGITVGSISLLDNSGYKLNAQTLAEKGLGAAGIFTGAKMLGLSTKLSLKITGFTLLFDAVSNLTEQVGSWVAEQLGNTELSKYYENFHWFGEDGFFDTVFQDITDLPQAWYDMWNDFYDWIGENFSETIKDVLKIFIDMYDWVKNKIAQLNPFSNNMDTESFMEDPESYIKKTVEVQFGVTIPENEKTDVEKAWEEISGVWKDKDADYTVDSEATSTQTVQNSFNKRSGFWGNVKSLFTVDSEATGTKEVESSFTARKSIWSDFVSNFKINSAYTKITDIDTHMDTRKNHWKDFISNFKIDSTYTKIPTIDTNMDTRKNHWKDFMSNFEINSNKTPLTTIQKSYNDASGIWQDKSCSFFINVAASGQSVFDSVKTSFNNAMASAEEKFRQTNSIFKNIKLPRLAVGGVIDRATIAMVGENGAEAVMPLERNTEWLGKMAGMIANDIRYGAPSYSGSSYTPANIGSSAGEMSTQEQNELLREEVALLRQIANKELTISEREVFNATRNASNNYYNRTGNSPFVF